MNSINLKLLQTFMTAAEAGSFRQAAAIVPRSPSAFSMKIRDLESQIGIRLLVRASQCVTLTPEGRVLFTRIQEAMRTGSSGMLPSSSIGDHSTDGPWHGPNEPVHGSAPDNAGQGVANPFASIVSIAMAMRHSPCLPQEVIRLEHAVEAVLESGVRPADLISDPDSLSISTNEFGSAVLEENERNLEPA